MKLYVMGKKLGGHASQVAQWMQGIEIESLGREDPLEEGLATQSSALAWGTQWTEEPGGLQSMGLQSRTRPSESKAPAGVPLKTCVSQWSPYVSSEAAVLRLSGHSCPLCRQAALT